MPTNPIFNRVYDREYFSGTQAGLYIGDVYVDEVVSASWSVQQTKTPIYGYASQLFDAVSAGPVLVTGNFTVNFKESGYLYLILMRYKQLTDAVDQVLSTVAPSRFTNKPGGRNRIPSPFVKDGRGKNLDGINRVTIERIMKGEASKDERFEFYNSLAGLASQLGEDKKFEDIVEVFEDQVWGKAPGDLDKMVRRSDDNAFDNFDMYMTFGDYNNRDANHTVRRISGVRLVGSSMAVTISGEPVMEEYSFIARNSF